MEGWAKAAEAGFTGEPHNPNLQPWSDTVCPPSAGRRTPKSAKANPSHVAEWTETQGGMSEILTAAARSMPRAQMGVRRSGPIQAHALEALVAKLAFLIRSLDRCAIPLL